MSDSDSDKSSSDSDFDVPEKKTTKNKASEIVKTSLAYESKLKNLEKARQKRRENLEAKRIEQERENDINKVKKAKIKNKRASKIIVKHDSDIESDDEPELESYENMVKKPTRREMYNQMKATQDLMGRWISIKAEKKEKKEKKEKVPDIDVPEKTSQQSEPNILMSRFNMA